MSDKCEHCAKTVYHAEKREHDGKKFHARCFNLWKKAQEDRERERKNRENYDILPDVSPAYYRVGDPTTGSTARMVSGVQERTNSGGYGSGSIPSSAPARSGSGSGGFGGEGAGVPKFCPDCGVPTGGGKFCGECGCRF
eukprot:TRINITY_DN8635_c0_g1_i8.p1 TRINITY_DN8635_c0_g1~~TRINITY_DN8635_c0_g1_i8.p1  ORF type:complete len:139 (+),score=30.19 TRINITY_DN8635_c0_g1_i8:167-583(+)